MYLYRIYFKGKIKDTITKDIVLGSKISSKDEIEWLKAKEANTHHLCAQSIYIDKIELLRVFN